MMETNEVPLLVRIAREEKDPQLFPPEVLDLYELGRPRAAQKALLRAAKSEIDPARQAKQRELAAAARIWVEPMRGSVSLATINGVGTRLYGRHQPGEDGAYVATQWFTFLFFPIWPIASFLVHPAESGGWYFIGKVPLAPAGRFARALFGLVVLVAALGGGWAAFHSATHVDVVAFNGYDEPVEVRIGDLTGTVQPYSHLLFEDVPAGATTFEALKDGAVFDSNPVDLSGKSGRMVLYNVGARGLVFAGKVIYGGGEPPEPTIHAGEAVLFLDPVDHVFQDPPSEIRTESRSPITKTFLMCGPIEFREQIGYLVVSGRAPHARTVVDAELRLHPTRTEALWMGVWLRGSDPAEAREFVRGCRERAPGWIEVERAYQNLWQVVDAEGVRAEYRARLEANPDSPASLYLLGRLLDDDRAEAERLYRRAIELDPGFAHGRLGLGYLLGIRGAHLEALDELDRCAANGGPDYLEERIRLARLVPAPEGPARLARLIEESRASSRSGAARIEAHLAVEADPSRLDAEVESAVGSLGEALPAAIAQLRAELSITAGDLARARAELGSSGALDVALAVRLALSDGASEADEDLLFRQAPDSLLGQGLIEAFLLSAEASRRNHPGAARFREAVAIQESEAARVLAVFEDGFGLEEDAALREALESCSLGLRSAAYAYAARRLVAAGRPAGEDDARRFDATLAEYRRLARTLGLPWEIPWVGPVPE